MGRGRRLLRRLVERRGRLAWSLVIGLSIEVVLLQLHDTRWLRDKEDVAIDWMMRMYSGTAPAAGRGLPFTIVDIDEQTYRAWEEPPVLPRDRLAGLIRFAVERGPAVVVVDVDLSRRTGPGDAVLERYLASLGLHTASMAGAPGSALPPILLARTFREALPPKQGYELRPSFLDGISAGISSIRWAAPLFELGEDLAVRRWRLIETVCADNRAESILSFQLLAVALTMHPPAVDDLQRMRDLRSNACQYGDGAHRSDETRIVRLGSRDLHVDDNVAKRIIYTIPWKLAAPTDVRPMVMLSDGRQVPFLIRLSAGDVLARPQSFGPDYIARRVVVIGGSFADARDTYPTPIGPMPGMFIVVNAINSLWQFDEFRPVPWWATLVVTTLLIVLMAVAFTAFSSFWASVVCGSAIIVVVVPASLLLFRSGIWLDFAVPLLAVELHQAYEELKEKRHKLIPRRG